MKQRWPFEFYPREEDFSLDLSDSPAPHLGEDGPRWSQSRANVTSERLYCPRPPRKCWITSA